MLCAGSWQVLEMENQNEMDKTFEKFTWTIQNFSNSDSWTLYSEHLFLCGQLWRILIFPKGFPGDYLSICLEAVCNPKMLSDWSKFARFKFAIINQLNGTMTITKETESQFNGKLTRWGFLLPLLQFNDPRKGFIVNDTCIIESELSVSKSEHEKQVDQAVSKNDVSEYSAHVCVGTIEHTDMSLASFGEFMDFRGLGKIKKAFVPLLDEVCSKHPSLIECQQKRSRMFTEWAFTVLGRVLHFLKTKKVKDMDDNACKHLQILWEELETFRFDLTWLEPHVQSALSMKSYMERAVQVKKRKRDVAAIEMEMKRLKAKMASAEVEIEIARRDLVEAEEGLEEKDLDAELGFGGP
ncbi:MATH domain and coiled-coil domain-containing protein At3g58210-like [Gastrolobium bilobum]|uniref:MATH domain and coiled-coil domain-containing protein At3g58210-like n=1 Tax=Gastrolobium bilobum TaxID=150636 RepID=UPI002AB08C0F|nr:MATH domain and coiled-coil domain-containing protein At3g58210-like [Gastrolobium bilobum]